MPIYNLTYPTLGQQLLPPDKRNNRLIAFVTCLLAPLQWLRDLWLGTYRTGSAAAAYNPATTYAKYARVLYNKTLYESLQNSNNGNQPGTSPAYWFVVQQNFIGLSERLLYNGQTITLTWAMNKWFGTNFRQPNEKAMWVVGRFSNTALVTCTAHGYQSGARVCIGNLNLYPEFNGVYTITVVDEDTFSYPNPGAEVVTTSLDFGTAIQLSDIYVLNNAVATPVFRAGRTEANSSDTFSTTSTEFVVNGYSFTNQINFTIYVPAAVYIALDPAMVNNGNIFRSFVNIYLPAGLMYNIQTY